MNPIEQKFKKKSNSIKINPSPGSWEVLRKRLDKKKRRNPIKMSIWLTAVASLLGIVILASLIFVINSRHFRSAFIKSAPVVEFKSNKDSIVNPANTNPMNSVNDSLIKSKGDNPKNK